MPGGLSCVRCPASPASARRLSRGAGTAGKACSGAAREGPGGAGLPSPRREVRELAMGGPGRGGHGRRRPGGDHAGMPKACDPLFHRALSGPSFQGHAHLIWEDLVKVAFLQVLVLCGYRGPERPKVKPGTFQ